MIKHLELTFKFAGWLRACLWGSGEARAGWCTAGYLLLGFWCPPPSSTPKSFINPNPDCTGIRSKKDLLLLSAQCTFTPRWSHARRRKPTISSVYKTQLAPAKPLHNKLTRFINLTLYHRPSQRLAIKSGAQPENFPGLLIGRSGGFCRCSHAASYSLPSCRIQLLTNVSREEQFQQPTHSPKPITIGYKGFPSYCQEVTHW